MNELCPNCGAVLINIVYHNPIERAVRCESCKYAAEQGASDWRNG